MARGKQVGRKTTTGGPQRTVNPPSELELSEEEMLTEAELFKDESVEAELRKDEPHEVSSEDGFGDEFEFEDEDYATEVEIDEDELAEDELTVAKLHEDAVKICAKNRCIDPLAVKTRSMKKSLRIDALRKMFVNYY